MADDAAAPGEGMFFLSDMEGRTIFASDPLYAFCGRPEGSANGLAWHSFIHPDDLGYVSRLLKAVLGRLESFAAWWRIVRQDGAYAWVMCGGAPLISEMTGQALGYMGAIYPLERPDAFAHAGGVTGREPDNASDDGASALLTVERIADMALMASALARESGEAEIAVALDQALLRIGFRLAELWPGPKNAPPRSVRRPGRQRRRSPLRS